MTNIFIIYLNLHQKSIIQAVFPCGKLYHILLSYIVSIDIIYPIHYLITNYYIYPCCPNYFVWQKEVQNSLWLRFGVVPKYKNPPGMEDLKR